MWLSQRRRQPAADGEAQVGRVTLPGDPAGVYLAGERRNLPVFGPGGYCWRPGAGEQALVIKTGTEGEQPCVAGVRNPEESDLEPGEVCIRTADGLASLRLEQGGVIRLDGHVYINGTLVSEPAEKEEG
jgi:hypothetical protein